MYHAIDFFFNDPIDSESEERHINTWDDWHIVASSRPSINLPEYKQNLIEITGMSGSIDISNVLTGYPLYGNREGSIEFIILNQYNRPDAEHWVEVYHKISKFLHGRRLKMVLTDDEPNFYYTGLFTVSDFQSGENNSTITINYILDPYKWARRKSNEQWIWDPFDLDYGIIVNQMYTNIVTKGPAVVSNPSQYIETIIDASDYVGDAPIIPEFIIQVDDMGKVIQQNTKVLFDIECHDDYGEESTVTFSVLYNSGSYHLTGTNSDKFETRTEDDKFIVKPIDAILFNMPLIEITYKGYNMKFDISFREGRL